MDRLIGGILEGKENLLDELAIDRVRQDLPRHVRWRLLTAIVISIIVVSAGVWWWVYSHKATVSDAASSGIFTDAKAVSDTNAVPALTSQLDASGYVVARRKATVSAPLGGRVMEILISEGMPVKAGDVLARLDDGSALLKLAETQAQLASAQAQLRATQLAFDNAGPIYQRMLQQSAAGFLSAQDLDTARTTYDIAKSNLDVKREAVKIVQAQVEIARRDLSDTIVRAPFSGTVIETNAQPGEIISPGAAGGSIRTGIGTIVDMHSLEVEVDVSENFIQRVHLQQAVTITLNAYPEEPIPGRVVALIPTADRAKATVKVRVGFIDRDERILPDMGVRVAFSVN